MYRFIKFACGIMTVFSVLTNHQNFFFGSDKVNASLSIITAVLFFIGHLIDK